MARSGRLMVACIELLLEGQQKGTLDVHLAIPRNPRRKNELVGTVYDRSCSGERGTNHHVNHGVLARRKEGVPETVETLFHRDLLQQQRQN